VSVAAARAGRQEITAVSLVSTAHMISHYHQIVPIALLPFLRPALGVGFVQLAFAITLMNVLSAVAQAPMGFLTDRVGSRLILVAGLAMSGLSYIAVGLYPSYPMLLVAAVFIGIGQAVYHPADYAILSAQVDSSRVGRAFSYHTFAGYVGAAAAPPSMWALASGAGIGPALIVAGAVAFVIALPLLFSRIDGEKASAMNDATRPDVPLKAILSPTIISFTVFFMMLSLSMGGLQNFSVVALSSLYGLPLAIGNMGLTAYLSGIALGILAGGWIADLTRRHGDVAAGGFALTAVLTFVIATVNLGVFVVLVMGAVGFLVGLIMPSRDMMVREAAPPGASGRVFGVVTTGFNISGTIGPMLYGFIVQSGQPRLMFFVSIIFMLLTIALPLLLERRLRHEAVPQG
jgi:MFS family permease